MTSAHLNNPLKSDETVPKPTGLSVLSGRVFPSQPWLMCRRADWGAVKRRHCEMETTRQDALIGRMET